MAGGLAALLDDIAAIAKVAAASIDDIGAAAGKASAKAVGVVVDDTAVTPRYVQGFLAHRELPIILKIARGSLRNKLVFILPVALLLSQFLPWLITPLLMVGGAYLSFEGAEKVYEVLWGGNHEEAATDEIAELGSPEHEKAMVSGAIRTDLILSAEIMAISLAEVATEPILSRAVILALVAVLITVLVYGVAALIVKLDDVGLALTERRSPRVQRFGRGLVGAMPYVMRVISTIGIAAMIWVGGHLVLSGSYTLGWHAPYGLVHHLEDAVGTVAAVGGILSWLVDTVASALVGLLVGFVVIGVLRLVPKRKARPTPEKPEPDQVTPPAE
jgi:predicted DNA repair protein MutK